MDEMSDEDEDDLFVEIDENGNETIVGNDDDNSDNGDSEESGNESDQSESEREKSGSDSEKSESESDTSESEKESNSGEESESSSPPERPKKKKKKKKKKKFQMQWKNSSNYTPKMGDASEGSTFREDLTKELSPFQILTKIVTDETVEEIMEESNRFVQQVRSTNRKKFKSWTDISFKDFWQFMALNFHMGLIKKPTVKDYWSTNKIMSTPIFNQVMSRDRYYL